MKYLDDMKDKWGFNDGDAMPADCWEFRKCYIRAINAVAEARGLQQRAVAFDRFGMHNSCLLLFADKDNVKLEEGLPVSTVIEEPGEGMQEVLSDLQEVDIDDAVVVTAAIDEEALQDLIKQALECTELADTGVTTTTIIEEH